MIKYGLKIWSSNYELIKEIIKQKDFDFVEIMPVPNTDVSPFKKIKIPFIIHIPHGYFGFNIADKTKHDFNLEVIKESVKWADELKAKYLILHTGWGEIKIALNFLKEINDKRILIENMPKLGLNNVKMIGSKPEEIKELMGDKFGFCLDFGHAVTLSKDYKKDIKEFLELKPDMFHISDGILNNETDEHYAIGQGDYDIEFMLDCVKKSDSKIVTMETPRTNLKSFEEDLINLEKLK